MVEEGLQQELTEHRCTCYLEIFFSSTLEMQNQAERADNAGEDQVRSLLSTITSFG